MSLEEAILLSFLQGEEAHAWGAQRRGWEEGSQIPSCDWEGVKCNSNDGSITDIDIPMANIRGTIPSEIGVLSSLRTLNLFGNHFVGTIPTELYNLPSLVAIDLGVNKIEGTLSRFTSSSMQLIHFEDNILSGSIPRDFGEWYPDLNSLDLGNNRFTGTIPETIFDFSKKLRRLNLRENHFHGTIPTTIGLLTELRGLFLNDNHFYGTIPKQLGSGSLQLVQIFMQHNAFSGTIPQGISEIRALTDFFVDGNKLTGVVPLEICQRDLNVAYFSRLGATSSSRDGCGVVACPMNSFSKDGIWPCEPCPGGYYTPYLGWNGECIQINEKQVLDDLFLTTGGEAWEGAQRWSNPNVPHCMYEGIDCNEQQRVIKIGLSGMNLKGLIPSNLGRLPHLRALDLSHNKLTGTVPSDLRFAPLDVLDISNNTLVGPLPPLLCQEEGLNGNGRMGAYSCDVLACAPGYWYPSGRAHSPERRCFPCASSDFLGARECNLGGVASAADFQDYLGTHTWPYAALLFVLASTMGLFVFAVYAKKRKRLVGGGEDDIKRSSDRLYEDGLFDGNAYEDSYGIMSKEEELSVISAKRRASISGAQQRNTILRQQQSIQSGRPQGGSSGAPQPLPDSQASPDDDPDTQDLWLDVPKIA